MKRCFFTLLIVLITCGSALATTDTTGPWGVDAGGFKNLSTALASPITVGKTVVVSKPMSINSKAVTGNRLVKVIQGGCIVVASGKSLTFGLDSDFAGEVGAFAGSGSVRGLKENFTGTFVPGVTDMTAAIITAQDSAANVEFTYGDYKTTSNIQFTKPVKFFPGAALLITSGTVDFFAEVDAGWSWIIKTADDFVINPRANTSVKFWKHRVKASWLGAVSVAKVSDIKTIPDQTDALYKAIRAAGGNYIPAGSNFVNESGSIVEINAGYYRVDKRLAFGSLDGGVYYRLSGGGMIGQGPGTSFLVRTDLAQTDYTVFMAFYTGELTVLRDLKITAYDPDAVGNKYAASAFAMLYCQGDSLQLDNVWVSGAQVSTTDSTSTFRNGVGIQFESAIDTFGSNVFVELCNINLAFSSSIVSLNNITSYASLKYNIGFGNYGNTWPDSQLTGNKITIQNLEMKGVNGIGIHVLSKGDNQINMDGVISSAYQEGSGIEVGVDFIHMGQYATLSGSISSARIEAFNRSLVSLEAESSLGYFSGLRFNSIRIINNNGYIGAGVFDFQGSTSTVHQVFINDISFENCIPIAFLGIKGNIIVKNIYLRGYTGIADNGLSRSLFIQNSGYLEIRGIYRESSDTTELTLGHQAAGTALIDAATVPKLTRTISGAGTKLMPSQVTFN